jgi:hypothetical protein
MYKNFPFYVQKKIHVIMFGLVEDSTLKRNVAQFIFKFSATTHTQKEVKKKSMLNFF